MTIRHIRIASALYVIATAAMVVDTTNAQAPAAAQEAFHSVPFEAMNGNEPDKLSLPRLIATSIVAQFKPEPDNIADVSAFQGEFIEAFLTRFPNAHALWTDSAIGPEAFAKKRLARFGDRVTYKVACRDGDISDGCVPKETDVILSSWVTMHQPIMGIAKFYQEVHAQLPSGGWLIVLDHVGFPPGSPWESALKSAQKEYHAQREGPPPFIKGSVPTLSEELAAFQVAGFDDVQVVWRSFTDALFMARKN